MTPQIIHPKSEAEWLELRKPDITSTEIGALFGLSDSSYIPTRYELWHRKKKNLASDFEPHDRIKWGQRLQDSIAQGVAEDQGLTVRRMSEYMRDPIYRLGASFDFSIEGINPKPDAPMTAYEVHMRNGDHGLLEIKNVDSLIFREKWVINDDDTVEAPPAIELQLQHQFAASGRKFGMIAAFIGGNRVVLIHRVADEQIIAAIRERVAEFWASIDADQEPSPDFKRDAGVIAKLYGYAEPGKVLDLRGDEEFMAMTRKHKELGDAIKVMDADRDAIKAQMLLKVGDAEKVLGDGFSSITLGVVGPAHIEYDREAYRMFRINWPRAKK